MTDEVTNLIAQTIANSFYAMEAGEMPKVDQEINGGDMQLATDIVNALAERSAAETTDEETILRAADILEKKSGTSTAGTLRAYVKAGYFVAVVPEAVKPIERPGVTINKSLAELLKLDEHPQVEADWQERMRSIAEAEFRAWAARDIRKLSQMDGFVAGVERVVSAVVPEDPKPLDPTPWFRWCDSEMPGAPAFERYARQSNGTEFKPREGYEQDESRYGVTPKAGA